MKDPVCSSDEFFPLMANAMQSYVLHFFFVVIVFFFFSSSILLLQAQPLDYNSANLSTLWTNNKASLPHTVTFLDGTQVSNILLHGVNKSPFYGPTFACGFFCTGACTSFLFAVYAVQVNSGAGMVNPVNGGPQAVWSANRNRPVKENATIELTALGDLVLKDADGAVVWSTNTSGKSVVGISITEIGNLVLLDKSNRSVWQSFEHPTDALVLGQSLREGQRLTANTSATNWTQGQYYLTIENGTLKALIDSSPPQVYFYSKLGENNLTFTNGSFGDINTLPTALPVQFMRLENDGHLRTYQWTDSWQKPDDVLRLDDCAYPTVCGQYGVCSNGKCYCPASDSGYFKAIGSSTTGPGCAPVTPLNCHSLLDHKLLSLQSVTYSDYMDGNPATFKIDDEGCKQACLKNCSCKAALFRYWRNVSDGVCFLPSTLYSMKDYQPAENHFNWSVYIKVQNASEGVVSFPGSSQKKSSISIGVVLGSSFGALAILFIAACLILVLWRRKKHVREEEEEEIDEIAGMPTRFSYEQLTMATDNFSKKLGQGGFGSVYEGKIGDEKIAVKLLGGVSQGSKEFLAEVQTIGNIHHFNLVRLIGFCASKSHRLLVYEYMPNGSLDKWIFTKEKGSILDWPTRRKIISDIAKGLSYLHEDCRQRIAHLDIKPQNILLDDNFNAKVSDFGLAKLIDRDQSHVMTMMRGTPGYLAPEWLTSIITEKVDVYSFGVMVLEIVCERKNLDYSRSPESTHLIGLLQEKIKIHRLLDLVYNNVNEMQQNQEELLLVIKLAIWCLHHDAERRPSMSTVIKVLEGIVNIETGVEYDFIANIPAMSSKAYDLDRSKDYLISASPPPSASLLSGPR